MAIPFGLPLTIYWSKSLKVAVQFASSINFITSMKEFEGVDVDA
jgi:hypothetical protein